MGTIVKACSVCGGLAAPGSTRCAAHPKRWGGGSTRAWRNQRPRILARDGYRCTHRHEDGTRCAETDPERLEVGHLADGPELVVPDHLLATQCVDHNPRGG